MRLGRGVPLRALGVAALLLAALGAARPATAEDLEELRSRAQTIADEVTGLEHRLAGLNLKKARLDGQITAASKSIAHLQLEIDAAEEAHRAASTRFVERAIEAYKGGGNSTRIALLLSARDLDDFFMLAQATSRQAELDTASLDELVSAHGDATRLQRSVDARKQRLLSASAQADTVSSDIEGALVQRRASLEQLTEEIERIEVRLRREARAASNAFPGDQRPTGKPDRELLEKLTGSGPSLQVPDEFLATGVTFEGLASWYGPGFEGNSTANGDKFDSRLYTAASKELPLGTWLHIKHEGRGVVVLVNDRGPYVEPRILDLSKAAAEALGMIGKGVGWVEAQIIVRT
jgi:rare lipoprotein A (peptidoglycan hydrolase)